MEMCKMELNAYRGFIGELRVLLELIKNYGDGSIPDIIELCNLYWEMYHNCEIELTNAIVQHGYLTGNIMDYLVKERGHKHWYYIEVKSTNDWTKKKFELNGNQGIFLREIGSKLAIVRLSNIQRISKTFDDIEDDIARANVDFFVNDYEINGNYATIENSLEVDI